MIQLFKQGLYEAYVAAIGTILPAIVISIVILFGLMLGVKYVQWLLEIYFNVANKIL